MLKKLEPAKVKLLEAADLLEKTGWCQGHLTDEKGQHCMLGALYAVADEDTYKLCRSELQAHLKVEWVAKWNNERGRTKEDVVSALRNAAFAPSA